MQFPNIWGDGGALFAYSGMDGETGWHHPLVGSTLDTGRGFVFHTRSRPILRFGVIVGDSEAAFDSVTDDIIGGDVVISHIAVGEVVARLEYVFADNSTVLARVTAEKLPAPVEVFIESAAAGAEVAVRDGALVQKAAGDHFGLACSSASARMEMESGRVVAPLESVGESVAFTWTSGVPTQCGRDFDAILDDRLAFYSGLPVPNTDDNELARTYYKCAAVMKVNCCTAQDNFAFNWTTPDRWPHKHMWIWDSAFHAIGLRHFAPEWAEDAIKAVLSVQRENGFVPHMMTPDGSADSDIIQPPILAWGVWKVYEVTRNQAFLEYCYPRIARMLNYDRSARDTDGSGLSEWESGGASGMDNSPRFDGPIGDAVDLNCYIAGDMRWLAVIARELGKTREAEDWEAQAAELSDRINEMLWDPETGFYYDNTPDGGRIRIKTEAGFTPLFGRVCSQEQADALVRHLTNPEEFWRPVPIPSVSADEPTYSDNMWRGPMWVNFNHFLVDALPHYGYADLAEELRRITVREVARWHTADGLIYEFFDSEGATDPVFLHRKALGGPQARKAAASLGTTICDYNFTAALYIDLLQDRA